MTVLLALRAAALLVGAAGFFLVVHREIAR